MKWIVIFVLIAVVASQNIFDEAFKAFTRQHNKVYKDAIVAGRALFHFLENQNFVKAHNARRAARLEDFAMAIYPFMDEDIISFIKLLCGSRLPTRTRFVRQSTSQLAASYPEGPASVDFTSYCLPVVNQGKCGSCWSFASVAQLESMYKKHNIGSVTPLSPQFAIDCDAFNAGCNGGWPKDALDYLKTNNVAANSSYPYTASRGACRTVDKLSVPSICDTVQYDLNGDENTLKNILAATGPIIVVVYVTPKFAAYKSGIFSDSLCATDCKSINHAMLLVGYGTDAATGKDFWNVRNSWGEEWGENGYVRMVRGLNNNCLTSCYAIFGKLC